jgi:hypothetical protein
METEEVGVVETVQAGEMEATAGAEGRARAVLAVEAPDLRMADQGRAIRRAGEIPPALGKDRPMTARMVRVRNRCVALASRMEMVSPRRWIKAGDTS